MNLGDGVTSIEPGTLVVSGDLHVALLNYVESVNHWMLIINKCAKRVVSHREGASQTDAAFFPDCKDEWNPRMWAGERITPAAAAAYPDTPPPQDAMMVFCLPVM